MKDEVAGATVAQGPASAVEGCRPVGAALFAQRRGPRLAGPDLCSKVQLVVAIAACASMGKGDGEGGREGGGLSEKGWGQNNDTGTEATGVEKLLQKRRPARAALAAAQAPP